MKLSPTIRLGRTGLLVAAILQGALGCTFVDRAASRADEPLVQLVAQSSGLPYTRFQSIVLLSTDRACMVDSYELRVVCGNHEWEEVTVIGRRGAGPGEFRGPLTLVRRQGGGLGVVDLGSFRLTLFSPEGEILGSTLLPPLFRPLVEANDSVVLGVYIDWPNPNVHPVGRAFLREDRSFEPLLTLHPTSEPPRPGPPSSALTKSTLLPSGEFVVNFYDYTLERFTPDGTFLGAFTSPNYEPELPNARDVEHYEADLAALSGGRASEAHLEALRQKPKTPVLPRGLVVGPEGLLWVATSRDRDRFSYFDLFEGAEYRGSVRVRDRMLGFDILGNTLAVLVERAEVDANGVRPIGIDWYEISPAGDLEAVRR